MDDDAMSDEPTGSTRTTLDHAAEKVGLGSGVTRIPDNVGGEFEVSYLEVGSGPLALCLHGYPDSAWTWRHLLPQLAAAGYRAVAPFSRGYHPTAIPADGCFQAGVLGVDANSLHTVLGGDGDAVVIGHDWGALGAYAAASLDPHKWRRVVAAAVLPGPVAAEAFFNYDQLKLSWYMFFQLTDLAEMVIPIDDYEFIKRLWSDWSPGLAADSDITNFVDCMESPENLNAALSYYRHTLNPELQAPDLGDAQAAALSMPDQPLLYLHGVNDGCMSSRLARKLDEHLTVPGSRTALIEDAGHFLHLEQPKKVNSEILSFLGDG